MTDALTTRRGPPVRQLQRPRQDPVPAARRPGPRDRGPRDRRREARHLRARQRHVGCDLGPARGPPARPSRDRPGPPGLRAQRRLLLRRQAAARARRGTAELRTRRARPASAEKRRERCWSPTGIARRSTSRNPIRALAVAGASTSARAPAGASPATAHRTQLRLDDRSRACSFCYATVAPSSRRASAASVGMASDSARRAACCRGSPRIPAARWL
jgi:hypothetical protein